jgi:hypothetical protein
MDMSLRDSVWTGHGQGMDNQRLPTPCPPPDHTCPQQPRARQQLKRLLPSRYFVLYKAKTSQRMQVVGKPAAESREGEGFRLVSTVSRCPKPPQGVRR